MKKIFFSGLLLAGLLLGAGCQQSDSTNLNSNSSSANSGDGLEKSVKNQVYVAPIESLEKTVYTAFIINTHDWTDPEESIATINRIIDLHEKYQLPVDIYLDDQVTQVYAKQAADLIDRLKTSSYAAVSYHLRPPYPYYWDYDWLGFNKMSNQEIDKILRDYEEHAIDLSTGEPTEDSGGYQYLKDLIGYAPYTVVVMGPTKVMPILAEIYKEKGAQFNLTHSGNTAWGEVKYGLHMRPEDLEVKVYEPRGRKSGEEILEESLAEISESRPAFMNLKWHEDNFYISGTPWGPVYWNDNKERQFLSPPYDLSRATVGMKVKTAAEQAEQWTRYEECLVYVKNHPEIFTAINAKNLAEMVER
jgi:hypothetical protein